MPLAIVLVGAAVAVWAVVFPPTEEARTTDVILVLGPADAARMGLAREMLAEGLSENLLVSVGGPGEVWDCWEPVAYAVDCQRSEPFTTRGELQWLREEMAAHEWTSATIVTMSGAVSRTRFIASQCGIEGAAVLGVGERWSERTPYDLAYQTAAFGRAIVSGC